MAQDWTALIMATPRDDTASVKASTYEMYHGLDEGDVNTLRAIGLALSSVSFVATCISVYWLVRMRRNFRHKLIVLLIVSDFMKSLWSMIYGIVTLVNHGQIESTGSFCQISGFFYAMGVEAADLAVFLIALHSTVYIFWPNRAGGESGLYPYRRYAYLFFGLWPILMASLAYSRGIPAYVNTGQSCYLPTAGKIFLSWIPRYLVLLIILMMYGASYTYVRVMMRRYSRQSSDFAQGRPDRLVPLTPPIDYHELLPPDPDPPRTAASSHYTTSLRTRHSSANHSNARAASGGTLHKSLLPALSRLEANDDPLSIRESLKLTFDRLHPGTRMKGTWSWAGFESHSSLEGDSVMSPAVSPLDHRRPGISAPMPGPPHPNQQPIWEVPQSENNGTPFSTSRPKLVRSKRKASLAPCESNYSSDTLRGRSAPDFYRRAVTSQANNAEKQNDERQSSGLDIEAEPVNVTSAPGALPLKDCPAVLLPSSRLLTGSQVHIVAMLRQGPVRLPETESFRGPHNDDGYDEDDPVVALDQATFEGSGISRSRDHIRRQLRLLFIYPAVYACVWVFPFVSDVTRFQEKSSERHAPVWILYISVVSLSVQGLCDTVVFWARERPWRHMRVGFWRSFGLDFFKSWRFTVRKDSGRTREEMFNDGTRARSRRDEEMGREGGYGLNPGGRMLATGGGVDWWDVEEGGSRGQDQRKTRVSNENGKGKETKVSEEDERGKSKEIEADSIPTKEEPGQSRVSDEPHDLE